MSSLLGDQLQIAPCQLISALRSPRRSFYPHSLNTAVTIALVLYVLTQMHNGRGERRDIDVHERGLVDRRKSREYRGLEE